MERKVGSEPKPTRGYEPGFDIDSGGNEDWIKTLSWDIWTPGNEKLVTTYDELKAALGGQGNAIEDFLKLPAAKPMPQALRDDLRKHGLVMPDTTTVHNG